MRRSLFVALFLFAACASDDSTDQDPIDPGNGGGGGSASFLLGHGNREFTELSDGDTVFLFRGPQGGYHLYLGFRAKGLDPSDVTVHYRYADAATGEVFGEDEGFSLRRIRLTDIGDGWFEKAGYVAAIDPELYTRPAHIRGTDITLDVTLTDVDGKSVSESLIVHVSEDPP